MIPVPDAAPTITVSGIETELGNRVIGHLVARGWVVAYEYPDSTIDKGIDFDAYTLVKDEQRVEFEWDNWSEWQICGSSPLIQALCGEFGISTDGAA